MTVLRLRAERNTVLAVLLAGVAFALWFLYILYSPAVPVLPPRPGGVWMRPGMPVNLKAYKNEFSQASFRKTFDVGRAPRPVTMSVTAYRDVAVFLDGGELPVGRSGSWKRPVSVTIPASRLAPGAHELRLDVRNRMAHPAVHVATEAAGLADIDGWESSLDGAGWVRALRCDDRWHVPLRDDFPTVGEGVQASLPFLLLLVLVTMFLSIRPRGLPGKVALPENVRYLLMFFWIALACNNLFKVPLAAGFDARYHLEYVRYLLEFQRLPVATDGVQMFQPPAYYLLAAAVYKVFHHLFSNEIVFHLLAVIQLASGVALIEITYRTLRRIFPERTDAQSCGLVVGALIPMNLYMCQYVGNEPLAGALTALALYLSVKAFTRTGPVRPVEAASLGVVTGVAILTKVTPVLLVPIVFLFLAFRPNAREERAAARWKMPAVFLSAASLVSGWYFVRNWVLLGKPFVGGWDPGRNFLWWQDPGYRVLRDFYSFGETFTQPVYACFSGFADAVYSTFWHDGYLGGKVAKASASPWNYDLLAAGTLLSLVPFAAIAVGVLLAARNAGKQDARSTSFLLAAIVVYLSALLHFFATLPIYSTTKASYTMGLTPGYAAMAAYGATFFMRFRYLKDLFVSLLVTWAVITYCGFFVV